MDLEEARQPLFKEILKELDRLNFMSLGILFRLYYKYINKQISFGISPITRHWEYPWAIINSEIRKGNRVLDAGCGDSPLLLYLYKKGYLCYGLDNKFSYEIIPLSSYKLKFKLILRLSKVYPFFFLFNPHRLEGLSNPAKALGFNIDYIKGNLTNLPFNDNTFNRIFCISVIEHLSEGDMFRAAEEFRRILKPQGLLIVTIDVWGTGLLWQDFIKASRLSLFGESDFTPPPKGKYSYDVVGFTLKKE